MTATVPAPSARTSAATSDWRTGDWFIARIAGLPLSTVDGLRCPRAADWAEEVLALRDRLAADGARVGDLLHDLIKGNEDEEARRRLLGAAPAGAQQRAARRPRAGSRRGRAPRPRGRRRTCGGGWPAGSGWPGWNTTAPPCSPPTSPGPAGELWELAREDRLRRGLGARLADPRRPAFDAFTAQPPAETGPPEKQAGPARRGAVAARLPVPDGLQDQPVQHVHRVSLAGEFRPWAPTKPECRTGGGWTSSTPGSTWWCWARLAELIRRRPGAPRRPAGRAVGLGWELRRGPGPLRAAVGDRGRLQRRGQLRRPPTTGCSSCAAAAPWSGCCLCCSLRRPGSLRYADLVGLAPPAETDAPP